MKDKFLTLDAPFAFKSDNDGRITIEGYASTNKINRYGYAIEPKAWTNAFPRQKPILLFNHDVNRAIGVVQEMSVREDGLFVKADILDEEIAKKTSQGIFSDFSVRFNIKKLEKKTVEGKQVPVVTELDGNEISVVSVPGDSYAQFKLVEQLSLSLDNETPEESMDELKRFLETISKELGCSATEGSVFVAVNELKKTRDVVGGFRSSLGLSPEADEQQIREALADARNPEGFIEKEKYDALQKELTERDAKLLLEESKGKFPPSAKEFALEMAHQGREKFEQWLGTVSGPPTDDIENLEGGEERRVRGKLNDEEKKVAKMLGLTEEDYAKYGDLEPHEALGMVFDDEFFAPTRQEQDRVSMRLLYEED